MNEDTYYPTEPQKLGEGYARARSAAATSGSPLDGPRCGRPRLVEARRDSDHAAMDPHYCPELRVSCAGGDERRRHSRAFRTRCGSSGNTLKRSSDAPRGGRRHGRPQPRASFGLGCAHLTFVGRQNRHLGCQLSQPTGHATVECRGQTRGAVRSTDVRSGACQCCVLTKHHLLVDPIRPKRCANPTYIDEIRCPRATQVSKGPLSRIWGRFSTSRQICKPVFATGGDETKRERRALAAALLLEVGWTPTAHKTR